MTHLSVVVFPQGDFGLSLFEDGVLPAAFMVGLLGASLVFAQVRARCQPCAHMTAGWGHNQHRNLGNQV